MSRMSRVLTRLSETVVALMAGFETDARTLFDETKFIHTLVDGMKNEVAFVRYHYILFAQKWCPSSRRS